MNLSQLWFLFSICVRWLLSCHSSGSCARGDLLLLSYLLYGYERLLTYRVNSWNSRQFTWVTVETWLVTGNRNTCKMRGCILCHQSLKEKGYIKPLYKTTLITHVGDILLGSSTKYVCGSMMTLLHWHYYYAVLLTLSMAHDALLLSLSQALVTR